MAVNSTAIKALSDNLTVMSDQRAAQKLAGQQVQLQSAIKQLPMTGGGGVAQAQALGGEVAKAAGGAKVEALKETQQTAQQVGQVGVASQGADLQQQVNTLTNRLEEKTRQQTSRVNMLSENLKDKQWKDRFVFQQKANGEKFLSEQQYQDWLRVKGAKEEEWKNYSQKSEILHQRKIQYAQTMHNLASELLQQASKASEQLKNQRYKQQVSDLKAYWADKAAKAAADSNNRRAAIVGVMTVAGAAAGSYFGPPGAMAGASVGGAAGNYVASST